MGDKTCSLVHFTQGGVEKELNKLGSEGREAFATYRTADGRNLGGYAAPGLTMVGKPSDGGMLQAAAEPTGPAADTR